MLKEVKHSQVTEIQVEIWLSDPTTRMLMQCLEWKRLDTKDSAGSGEIVDSSNSDLTHAMIHRALGQQDVYADLQTPEALFDYYEMIDHPEPPEEIENE